MERRLQPREVPAALGTAAWGDGSGTASAVPGRNLTVVLTAWATTVADLPASLLVLLALAGGLRPLALLIGLLAALRRAPGSHRVQMYARFAEAFHRCRNRPPHP
jgi:hypothetical protein